MNAPQEKFIVRRIRLKKEDSAFVYYLFEATEGWLSYSTLPHQVGDLDRKLELRVSPDFKNELEKLLDTIRNKDGVLIEEC